ncbi:hypothetical protein SNEBB_008597 [Seison nebaliae]|nr:hypothetical protein SNEBB_008597 [Seison nebaliae]
MSDQTHQPTNQEDFFKDYKDDEPLADFGIQLVDTNLSPALGGLSNLVAADPTDDLSTRLNEVNLNNDNDEKPECAKFQVPSHDPVKDRLNPSREKNKQFGYSNREIVSAANLTRALFLGRENGYKDIDIVKRYLEDAISIGSVAYSQKSQQAANDNQGNLDEENPNEVCQVPTNEINNERNRILQIIDQLVDVSDSDKRELELLMTFDRTQISNIAKEYNVDLDKINVSPSKVQKLPKNPTTFDKISKGVRLRQKRKLGDEDDSLVDGCQKPLSGRCSSK